MQSSFSTAKYSKTLWYLFLHPVDCSKSHLVHDKFSQNNSTRSEVYFQALDRHLNSTSWSAIAILLYLSLCQINPINALVQNICELEKLDLENEVLS